VARKRFINPHQKQIRRTLWDLVLWRSGVYNDIEPTPPRPEGFIYPNPFYQADQSQPCVTWLNHSSFLVQVAGVAILTDPIWSERCSPLSFFGPKRRHSVPLSVKELPRIDYVLISHNHYDHLDIKSVLQLFARFPEICWLVPTGVKSWFLRRGIKNVIELGWWEEVNLSEGIKATCVPAQHFSGRSGRDLNTTLWCGWVFEAEKAKKRFYFVGDTGYNPHDFKEIGKRWTTMDLSLIPIGSYVPRRFMSPVHIEPRDAVRIHQEVGSHLSIAMHWKTFRLSDEPMLQPPYDLFLAMQEQGLDPQKFLAPEPGDLFNW
jgi:N-acyl-phosphatidylethanolamine-hydrolysing phospholipase D